MNKPSPDSPCPMCGLKPPTPPHNGLAALVGAVMVVASPWMPAVAYMVLLQWMGTQMDSTLKVLVGNGSLISAGLLGIMGAIVMVAAINYEIDKQNKSEP